MALNEYDSKRQYTQYKRHVNESNERVNAETVNKLQTDINTQQQDTNQVKDTAFEERVYTIFNNNLFTNAMFIDYYKTGEYLNVTESSAVVVDFEKSLVTIDSKSSKGTAVSTKIFSVHGVEIETNDFFLITNDYAPIGANIKYFLETHTGERWPIIPNALKLPLHLSENIAYGFKVVIELTANALDEKPYVNGYALLYWDKQVELNYGMTNPDLPRFP